jgi:FkbM family methyltransferase
MTTLSETSATASANGNRLARFGRQAHRWWWAVVERLDRPGRRWLLVVPGSLWVSGMHRAICLVHWQDGVWIHHYRGAKIPHAVLGRASPPSIFTAEARETFLWGYTPRAGDVVFDIGAGIGAETLLFSRLVGRTGRVVSLEAHPRTYERLARLCDVNRLANVIPLNVAAADAEGTLRISDLDHYLQNTVLDIESDGIEVPARRLDALAHDLDVTSIDLLKMNIEGAERLALAGLEEMIERTRHVCIGCHDFLADSGGPEEMRTKALIREFLVDRGFRVTARDDAADPWTRDYLYGVNTRTADDTPASTRT